MRIFQVVGTLFLLLALTQGQAKNVTYDELNDSALEKDNKLVFEDKPTRFTV